MDGELANLAGHLFKIDVFLFRKHSPDGNGFKLKVHEEAPELPLAPLKVNLRTAENIPPGPMTPSRIEYIGSLLSNLAKAKGISFDYVAGIPAAGDPFAKVVSDRCEPQKGIVTFKKRTTKNRKRTIWLPEHPRIPGKVLLIDDVISRGRSKVEAISALRMVHCEVSDICVVVDREEGAREALARYGIRLHSLFTLGELLAFFEGKGFILPGERKEALAFSEKVRGLHI